MRECFLSVLFLFLGSAVVVKAQVNWSVKAGGGVSNLIIFYKSDLPEKFEGSFFSQAGITFSGDFAKEGMVSWQSGLALQRSGFKSIPMDFDKMREQVEEIPGTGGISHVEYNDDNKRPRDYDNAYLHRTWSIDIPFTIVYHVFDVVDIVFGVSMNYSLLKVTDDKELKINPTKRSMKVRHLPNAAGHLGLSVPISRKLTLQGIVFSDINTILNFDYDNVDNRWSRGYRRAGFTMDILYRIGQ